jgi:two-component system, OmpR family, alkaline phosphatase synthesis response regulator PhoP
MQRIVAIEDEADILEVVAYNLKREGFEVSCMRDGEEGLTDIRRRQPDLVLLDLMLPGIDGLEICRQLKSDSFTKIIPIVMLTAKGEESDIVLGLGMGADDYITKPFSPKELVARVKAVLRRGPLHEEAGNGQRIICNDVVIDPGRHEVVVAGVQVLFTATEFKLLHYLAGNPGRVFTREHLINRIIGEDSIVLDRNIDVHVRAVRKKLEASRDLIETIRGVGYRFRDI